jgi:hypothetical protein
MGLSSRLKLLFAVAGAMIVVGGVLIVQGLMQLDLAQVVRWTSGGAARVAAWTGAMALVLAALARRWQGRVVPFALAYLALALVALGAIGPLLGVASMALAFTLVGQRVRALWGDRPASLGDIVYSTLVGAGVYGTLTGVLAHWPVSNAGLYVFLVAAPIVVGRGEAWTLLSRLRAAATSPSAPGTTWLAVIGSALLLVYATVAPLPQLGSDGLALHLHVATETIERHQWHFDVTKHVYAVLPMLGNWLMTIAFAFGGETAARLLVAGFVAIIAFIAASIVRDHGGKPAWAWLAGVLVLSTPISFAIGSSLFIDSMWAAFLVGGLALLVQPDPDVQRPQRLITAAVLLGFSAAAKSVTLPLVPVLIVLALVKAGDLRQSASRNAMLAALVLGTLAAVKPYATAWVLTGNPVFPFFNEFFGSPLFPAEGVKVGQPFLLGARWDDLYSITLRSGRHIEGVAGAAGFQWLLLLPAAVLVLAVLGPRRALWLPASALAMFIITFHFISYLRYVVPAFVLFSAAIALAGSRASDESPAIGRIAAGVAALCLAINVVFLNSSSAYGSFPLAAAFGDPESRRALIIERAPHRLAAQAAAELSQRTGRIAFFSPAGFADARMDAVHASWYSPAFFTDVRRAESADALADVLSRWDVRHLVVFPQPGASRTSDDLDRVTSQVGTVGILQIRKPRSELVLTRELMRNGDFASTGGWTLVGSARHDAAGRTVTVSADAPAYQAVDVTGGALYLLTVDARCDRRPTEGRLQIIWHGPNATMLRTDAEVFRCSPEFRTHARELVSPADAHAAIVYATGHTAEPIVVRNVSLRTNQSAATVR